MFRLLLLLISLPAWASDGEIHTNVSGYSYYSYVSNEDFKESNSRLALNLSASTDEIGTLSAQLSTHPLSAVQRLDLMIPLSVADRHQGGINVGRLDKSSWFFSQIVESPGSMGVRYVPQSVYDEAFVASLSNFDGFQFFNTTFSESGDYRVTGRLSVGKPMMSKQEDIQKLMFDTTALADDVELVGDYDSYAASIAINLIDTFEMFWEHTVYNAHFESVSAGDTPFEQAVVSKILAAEDPWLRTLRGGLRLSPNSVFRVTGEYYLSNFNTPSINGSGWMVLTDYCVDDSILLFAGYGENASDVTGLWSNSDAVVGVNYSVDDFFIVGEFHKLTGSSLTNSGKDEGSYVFTVGYEF